MRRLDEIVSELLAGVALRIEREKAGGAASAAAPPLAHGPGGEHPGTRNQARHPITSTRRMAKKATGIAATKSMKR